jgi:membrane-associated phospholipid phosphatase
MQWFQDLDVGLFRYLNQELVNPTFDQVMPFLSGNKFFIPALVVAGILLIWKGGARGRVCVFMLAVIVSFGDGFICRNIKHAVGRQRPFVTLPDTHRPGHKKKAESTSPEQVTKSEGTAPAVATMSDPNSMPSAHAANWFAGTMVAFIYFRRSIWFMLPVAIMVAFSRIYNGVHYPGDVLAGAILGAGYAAAIAWSLDAFWTFVGRKWFPLWWERMPSLLSPRFIPQPGEMDETDFVPPPRSAPRAALQAVHVTLDQQWLRLGYLLTGLLLLARLAYLASGTIQLSEDEAYQWLWSKHLAISYYSKPPLIAYTQFLGTSLWGDNAFGVRFFSPIIAAALSLMVLRFFAREVNARAGFLLLLIISATPLTSVGAVLMTVDPLSVLFWTAAMLAGWRAIQDRSSTKEWVMVGVWMGFGFLSKATELFQLLCWVLFFILWPPARKQLRRAGPYLALLINAIMAVPVLIWNCQRDWPTIHHLADNAGMGKPWKFTLKYFLEFIGGETGLLNPIFCVAMVWAAITFWRRSRNNPRLVYFFSMGAPVFLFYFFFTFHSRVLPNWIAPSVLPLFILMTIYWDTQWRLGLAKVRLWLATGLIVGFTLVILGHNTDLVKKMTGRYLPVKLDPLHRVRGWSDVARVAGEVRQELLAEGKPVFIIANHYGIAGHISFYLPEARAGIPENPLVYFLSTPIPRNQFYFWPGYNQRKGESAIFVNELNRDHPQPGPPPAQLETEFESVTDLGVRNVMYHDKLLRPLQFFACRGLR